MTEKRPTHVCAAQNVLGFADELRRQVQAPDFHGKQLLMAINQDRIETLLSTLEKSNIPEANKDHFTTILVEARERLRGIQQFAPTFKTLTDFLILLK